MQRPRFVTHVLPLVLTAVAVAGIGAGVRLLTRAQRVAAQAAPPLQIAPYTVVFKETIGTGAVAGAGNPRLSRRGMIATKADGSSVEKSEVFNQSGQLINSTRHIVLATGIEAEVDDLAGAVVAVSDREIAQRSLALRWLPQSGCADRPAGPWAGATVGSLNGDRIASLQTVGFSVARSNVYMQIWRAPEAGCEDLRRVVFFKDRTGTTTDWSERLAEQVTIGAPDQAAFSVPDSYARVTFTEAYLRELARCCSSQTPDPNVLQRLQQVDAQTAQIKYLGSLQQ